MIYKIFKWLIFLVIAASLIYGSFLLISRNIHNAKPELQPYIYSDNGFFYKDDYLNFNNKRQGKECEGVIIFPYLSRDNLNITNINDEIYKFAMSYGICNKGKYAYYSQKYEIPNSSTIDVFSIKFLTYKKSKNKEKKSLWRIDTLNYSIQNGDQINIIDDVLNKLSKNMITEFVQLSKGRLDSDITWEDFKEKIKNRDIQFYIKDNKWYIVFNTNQKVKELLEVEVPEYFMQGEDTDVTRAR